MTDPQKIETPDDRLFDEEIKAFEDEVEASFATPYTDTFSKVLARFDAQQYYAKRGDRATIEFGKGRNATLSWKKS